MEPNLLLIDDDPAAIQLLGRVLGGVGRLRFATSGVEGLELANATPPDLVLLDAQMPGLSGFEVCRALKANLALAEVPVIFVTSHRDEAFEIAGFESGAADFIGKPFSPPLVLARVNAQLRFKQMADELRISAMVDPLTGVANRRRLDEALANEWSRAKRARDPISLVLVDVDHFKLYNDRYGHIAGDACLRAVACALRNACQRPGDLVARYGGEEFALLLPQTPSAGAQHVAGEILDCIHDAAIPHAASLVSAYLTVSAGVASFGVEPEAWDQVADGRSDQAAVQPSLGRMTETADAALYAAKKAGRNQACAMQLTGFSRSAPADELPPVTRVRSSRPSR